MTEKLKAPVIPAKLVLDLIGEQESRQLSLLSYLCQHVLSQKAARLRSRKWLSYFLDRIDRINKYSGLTIRRMYQKEQATLPEPKAAVFLWPAPGSGKTSRPSRLRGSKQIFKNLSLLFTPCTFNHAPFALYLVSQPQPQPALLLPGLRPQPQPQP